MATKRFKNDETGEEMLFTKVKGKWVPAIEHERQKIAEGKGRLSLPGTDIGMDVPGEVGAFFTGAGKKVDDLANLFRDEKKDSAGYDALKKAFPKSVMGGEIASEIAQIALPGAGIAKGVKGAGKFAPAIGDFAASVGTAGLRGDSMLAEGAWSLGGSALAPLLKLVRGARTTPEALEYGKRGGHMNPGQAVEGTISTNVDSFLRNILPVSTGAAQRGFKNAADIFHTLPLKEATLPGRKITQAGTKGAKQLLDQTMDAYSKAWNKIDGIPPVALRDLFKGLAEGGERVSKRGTDVLDSIRDEVADVIGKMSSGGIPQGEGANIIDGLLSKEIGKATDYRLIKELQNAKDGFRKGFPDLAAELAPVDAKYPELLTINRATKAAHANGGKFSPSQLQNAGESVGKDKFGQIKGENPLQEIADLGQSVIERDIPSAPIISNITGLFGPAKENPIIKGLSNLAVGNTKPQRAVGKVVKALEDAPLVPGAGAIGAGSNESKKASETEEEWLKRMLGL